MSSKTMIIKTRVDNWNILPHYCERYTRVVLAFARIKEDPGVPVGSSLSSAVAFDRASALMQREHEKHPLLSRTLGLISSTMLE